MKYVRGSTITIKAEPFLDADGAAVTPSTVTAYLDYPDTSRARTQDTVSLTLSGGEWTGDWDSSVAGPGTVFYAIQSDDSATQNQDGQFELTANLANPDPS